MVSLNWRCFGLGYSEWVTHKRKNSRENPQTAHLLWLITQVIIVDYTVSLLDEYLTYISSFELKQHYITHTLRHFSRVLFPSSTANMHVQLVGSNVWLASKHLWQADVSSLHEEIMHWYSWSNIFKKNVFLLQGCTQSIFSVSLHSTLCC